MRKGLKKKVSIMAASCLAIACVSAGGATLASVAETADPVLSMENGGAFYTVPGASVKIHEGVTVDGIDGNAMRFTFEMSEAQYASMFENGEYKNGASVSAYVIAEEKIDEGKTTAAQIATDTDAVKAAIPASKWQSATSIVEGSTAKVYYACAYVYDLPDSSVYDKNVSAFAIATQADNTTLYSSVQSRSMAYVADAALDSGKYVDKTTTLESYLPTYDVSFYDEDGVTVLGTTQARYGSAAVATDAVNEVLIGENVAEFPRYTAIWYEKTGNAWAEEGNALSAYEVTGNTAYKMSLTDNGIMKAKLAAKAEDHATVNGYNLGGIVADVADNVVYSNGGNTVMARSDGNWFYPFSNTVGTEYSYKATIQADATYYQARDSVTTYMPGASIATSNADGSNAFAVTAKFAYWEPAGSVVLSISTLGYRTNVVLYGSFADVYASRNADYSNWGDGELNATVEFVKTETNITLYVQGVKMCTMTADGVTLAAGVTSSADATLTSDNYKTRLACFFGEGVESVCGIQGESMKTSLDFTYTVEQKAIDSSKNFMKYDEATGTVVYDGETPATSAQSQWYYLEGSGNSVYLDTTITTDGAADVAQGAEGIIIKVGNKARRVLFANSGVYVFTEDDGLFVNGVYTNSGLTDGNGNYAIYQALTTFGKYFDINIEQQTGNETPYGTWYGASRYTWGDISACNRVVYIINDGYLYIALGADESSVTAFLKLDLNCLFNGMITQDTMYKIGYASTGTRYWNNNAPRESGIVENPTYAYKTNEVVFGADATSKIAQAIAKYSFSDKKQGMTTNASGQIVNDGTLDGSSNYFYLAGSGKTVYLNTDIVTDGFQTRSGANTQGTDGIIIRVGETVRRVLFAGTGVYVFTENDGNYVASAGTGAAQYINSGLTDSNGNYAIYQSMVTFGKYFDTSVKEFTNNETPYGTWYGSAVANGYGRLNNGTATGNVSTNVTYVIDGSYLYIALDGKAYLKLDLNCLFYGLITEDTVFEVGYASCGNKYGGSNTNQGAQTEVWYSYKTNEILYGDDATAKIAGALALFNS